MPHDNPAELRSQEVKSITNILMDLSVSPKYLWLLCMLYMLQVLNCLVHPAIVMRPLFVQAALGFTIFQNYRALCVISLCFNIALKEKNFFQRKKLGRFVGVSANKGDGLTKYDC